MVHRVERVHVRVRGATTGPHVSFVRVWAHAPTAQGEHTVYGRAIDDQDHDLDGLIRGVTYTLVVTARDYEELRIEISLDDVQQGSIDVELVPQGPR